MDDWYFRAPMVHPEQSETLVSPLVLAKIGSMEIWELNLRHLRAISEIERLGTMQAAAVAVNLTQPAITQALAGIEAALGLALFERHNAGMAPTAAANLLVPRINEALRHVISPHVTMSRFKALLTLAEAGSYAGASAATGLSLPSLHRAVNDLSLATRKTLVERRGKSVVLTNAGMQMARAFRLARVELEAGLSEMDALKGKETRRLAIGAMPLSRARVLPAAVCKFMLRNPGVRISILEGSRAELLESLRNGVIDLMVGALREPLIEPDCVQQPLFDDLPVVIGRAGHPLASCLHDRAEPALIELAAYPWVVAQHGAPLRDSWERLFSAEGIAQPSMPIESGSVMFIRQLLIGSDFLTLLSLDQVAVELEAGWLSCIARLPSGFGRTIGVTTRESWRPTSVQAEFLADLSGASEKLGS